MFNTIIQQFFFVFVNFVNFFFNFKAMKSDIFKNFNKFRSRNVFENFN